MLPLDDRIYVGTVGNGVQTLSLDEASNPSPLVEIATPVIDGDHVVFRWQAFAFEGELPGDQVETRYRLDAEAWSRWSQTREVGPLSVSSGRHRFTVQAKSLFGTVATPGTTIPFRITPPLLPAPAFSDGCDALAP